MAAAPAATAPRSFILRDRRFAIELAVGLAALAILLLAPAVLSDFRLNQMGKFLSFAIIAIGIDLLWGYTGMLSLGQGVFFGLGGYAMAMYLKLEASGEGIPDFMTWSGVKTLPWFWAPFEHAWFAFPVAILGPGIVAFLFGYLVFRRRVTGVYFSIVTQALALILSVFLVGQQAYSGGTNGITNYTTLFGATLRDPSTQQALYLVTVGALALTYVFARCVTGSRLGRLLVAVRDDESRVRFTGYNVALVKASVFAVAAMMAGLAGALFVPQVGIISPANLGVVPSIEMVLWVAVGGRGTLAGAVLGAVFVSWARSYFSESQPETWLYLFGALFIGSVAFFRRGLAGLLHDAAVWVLALRGRLERRREAPPSAGTPEVVAVSGGSVPGDE